MLFISKPGLQGSTDTDVWFVPVTTGGTGYNSDFVAFTTATPFTGIGVTMAKGHLYAFQATADCWIRQSVNATTNAATKGAGSMFVQKGVQVVIDGSQGAQLSVLADGGAGNASLVEITA